MNRYIEKDKVLSLLGLDHNDYVYIDKRELAKRIEKLKGINIVRCKECKWYDIDNHECPGEVNSTDHEGGASYSLNFYDDDYCSYGKREDDDN